MRHIAKHTDRVSGFRLDDFQKQDDSKCGVHSAAETMPFGVADPLSKQQVESHTLLPVPVPARPCSAHFVILSWEKGNLWEAEAEVGIPAS